MDETRWAFDPQPYVRMNPKIIQIATGTRRGGYEDCLYALKDDGTVWLWSDSRGWVELLEGYRK